MIARLRQRRALAPAIARRIVFLVARHRLAPYPAAEREQLVVDRRGCDLPAHGRHGCLLRPISGWRRRLRGSPEGSDDQSDGEGKQQSCEGRTHVNLPLRGCTRGLDLIDGGGLTCNRERRAGYGDLSRGAER